jgi:Fe-S-cluster containining protein
MSGRNAKAARAAARLRGQAVRAIWARLPETIGCKGLCTSACTWIRLTDPEREIIRSVHGFTFPDRAVNEIAPGTFRCIALKDGQCSIYNERPLICRAWGAVQSLPCPHGCRPPIMRSDAEMAEIFMDMWELEGAATFHNRAQVRAIMERFPSLWDRVGKGGPDADAAIRELSEIIHASERQ